jgi:hypothetical protein
VPVVSAASTVPAWPVAVWAAAAWGAGLTIAEGQAVTGLQAADRALRFGAEVAVNREVQVVL